MPFFWQGIGGSDGKESACNVEYLSSIPELGKIPWRREQIPIPVLWPGELHEQRSLAGYSPWGHKELDTTEQLSLHYDNKYMIRRFTNMLSIMS